MVTVPSLWEPSPFVYNYSSCNKTSLTFILLMLFNPRYVCAVPRPAFWACSLWTSSPFSKLPSAFHPSLTPTYWAHDYNWPMSPYSVLTRWWNISTIKIRVNVVKDQLSKLVFKCRMSSETSQNFGPWLLIGPLEELPIKEACKWYLSN